MHRSSFLVVLTVLAVVLPLAGCNTMFQKTYQKIGVHTPGVKNVECILEAEHTKYRMIAPGLVEVDRSSEPLTVTCHKAGYLDGTGTLRSKIQMAPSKLNLFNGIIPGVGYDIASGSIHDYPDDITIKMRPDPDVVQLPAQEINVLQKKPVEVQPPAPTPAAKTKTEKTFSKSLQK